MNKSNEGQKIYKNRRTRCLGWIITLYIILHVMELTNDLWKHVEVELKRIIYINDSELYKKEIENNLIDSSKWLKAVMSS